MPEKSGGKAGNGLSVTPLVSNTNSLQLYLIDTKNVYYCDRLFKPIKVDSEENRRETSQCFLSRAKVLKLAYPLHSQDSMTTAIAINSDHLHNLDLSPAVSAIDKLLREGVMPTAGTAFNPSEDQQLRFDIDYPREPDDPRELSEIPEVRLWFIRLDARYPWLPLILDWKAGELARYTAMLVPHQFSRKEGIQYNPEALEIFVMQKIFILMDWMKSQGIEGRASLKSMTQMLGYEIDDAFFDMIR